MAKKIIKYDVAIKSTKQTWQMDVPKVYTNDLNSVVFQFVVSDLTTEELSTATATTLIYMKDGSFFQNPSTDVSKVGTTFSYTLKENEGNHDGIAQIQLVVTIPAVAPALPTVYASQLYEFEVVSGLEMKVSQEVMIYDWTTLTRDAQAYIDQFNLNEATRQQQFADAQTARTTTFNQSETDRTTAFNTAEDGRATAETDRVTAESNRVTAESNRVTAESNRVTAESGRVTAESGRVTAESGRVTAETNRAAAFTAFNTRLTAEETATANNKISAVKGKTFADVDARLEDVEFDTTAMGTNLITNGDFSNGLTGWLIANGTAKVANKILTATASNINSTPYVYSALDSVVTGDIYYIRANTRVLNAVCNYIRLQNGDGSPLATRNTPAANVWYTLSAVGKINGTNRNIMVQHSYADAATANGQIIEVQYVSTLNLTAIFGKGNEPTAEQMDAIMAKFPNSWFNGTANLFRASETLKKQIALDVRTEFDVKNLVTNGDFSNGTTGWTEHGVTSTISSGVLNATLTASGGLVHQQLADVIAQDKIYIAGELAMVAVDSANTFVRFRLSIGNIYANILSPTIGQLSGNAITRFSAIDTASVSGQLFGVLYGAGNHAIGDTMKMSKMTVINLTKTFGAGKEPTLAEMDRLMARFPNSWFDGVKPIQTIETLYQEKANKVQEAWITPTLLNGWVQFEPNSNAAYMKDEFGFVHLKGKLKSGIVAADLFSLPVGYRSNYSKVFPCSSSGNVASIVISNVVYINSGANNASISLDGITFKAEV